MITPNRTHGTNGCCRLYESEDGRFSVEVSTIAHHHGADSLMDLWTKNGHPSCWMKQTLNVSTYYTDDDDRCWDRYNLQEKRQGTRNVLEFAWMLEATPENEVAILAECERRYLNDERNWL